MIQPVSIQSRIASELQCFGGLFDIFESAGFQLYAVGGCVRDWALGRTPKDIDFTTDALPSQTKQILASCGYSVIPVGEAFGTIAVNIQKKTYEITTFRVKESYTRGSRHPVVCYGRELARDLERRDLTINAMAARRDGTIVDPFDGLGDLERHLLRVPMSSYERSCEIFGDDPLRILRLARFKARLGFEVSPDGKRAAGDMAGSVLTVSHERWFSELDGMLRAANPADGLNWLAEVGVLPLIWPELALLRGKMHEPTDLSSGHTRETHEDLWDQTIRRVVLASPDGDERWIALFSLLGYGVCTHGDWAENVTAMLGYEIAMRLKFSVSRAESLVRGLTPLPAGAPSWRAGRELAILLGHDIGRWNAVMEMKLQSLSPDLREKESARLAEWRQALAPWMADPESAEIHLPRGLSQALMKALGVSGKTLGLYLAHCREAVLDQMLAEDAPADDFIALCKDQSSSLLNGTGPH